MASESNNTSHHSTGTVSLFSSTPFSNHVASASAHPAFAGKIGDVDKYIAADVATTVSKPFKEFLRAMLGANKHIVDQKDPILQAIASSAVTKALRHNYCSRALHESTRYGTFCELTNHIISQLPGEAQRPSFVFCRNDPHNVKGVHDNNRKPDVVVLSGQDPSVVDGGWRIHSAKGPQDVSWTWPDIQHVFEFKLSVKQILYSRREAALTKEDKPNASGANDNVSQLVVSPPVAASGNVNSSSHATKSKFTAATNQRLSALANPPSAIIMPIRKRPREDEEGVDSSESSKRQREGPRLLDTPGDDLLKQGTRYAIDRISSVPNLSHVLFGLVRDSDLWMCYYDHGGIVCSQRLTFVSDLYSFVVLIKALVDLSPNDRGIIKGFRKYDPKDFDDVYIDLSRAPSPNDKSDDPPVSDASDGSQSQDDTPDDPPAADTSDTSYKGRVPNRLPLDEQNDDSPKWYLTVGAHDFLVRYPLTKRKPYGLIGRASRVNAATCGTLDPLNANRVFALKTSWPAKRRMPETNIIELARKVLDELDGDKSFKEKHSISSRFLSDCLPRVFLSEDIEDLEDGFRSRIKFFMDDSRVFRVIAFEQLYPIYYEVSSLDIFKQLFREIFQGHHFLFICLYFIKHRDISVENLMYRKMPDGTLRGVLNDWDLAKVGNSTEAEPKGTRTGTRPFMSRDILVPNPPDHLERFDWESMLYVLIWIACHYNDGKVVNPKALETWLQDDMLFLSQIKEAVLFKDFDYALTTTQFRPLCETWLEPLRRLFSEGYSARLKQKNVELFNKGKQDSVFDNVTLGGHVTYEKIWAVLGK